MDRDSEMWLMFLRNLLIENESVGRMTYGSKSEFLFYCHSMLYQIVLDLMPESTTSIHDRPYNTYWKLISFAPLKNDDSPTDPTLILNSLGEALKVYGRNGNQSIKNNIVELKI